MTMRYLSVCSGMEAASVAWHPLGWTPVGFSEIEPFPCAILKHRFPNTPNYGSLTEYQSWPLEPGAIDLLVGGTPCQSFSVAGLRKGLTDPRGNLALTFLGLADKLKPRWIVWENVPGVLSSNGGRDFGSFVGALGQLGYGWAMRILDAQHFGVPQRRRRVFVVACLGDWRAAAEVLSLREGLRGYLETGNKKRKGVAADAGAGVEASGLPRTVGTICADTHPGAYTGQDAYTGRLIPAINPAADVQPYTASSFAQYAEGVGTVRASGGDLGGDLGGGSETLLTQPKSHWDGGNVHPTLNQSAKGSGGVGSSNQELFSQGGAYLVPGEATPFRKSKRACSTTDNETWVLADSSKTLNNFDLGDTRTTHAVVQPVGFSMREDATNGTFDVKQVDTSLCLQALRPAVTSHHAQNIVVQHQMPGSVAQTIGASGPPYSRTGNERVEAEALAVTLNIYGGNKRKDRPEGGMYVKEEDTTKCLDAANGLNPTCSQGGTAVLTPMAVRRLTPVECERLQGFPDDWTQLGDTPDSRRYSGLGDAVTTTVAEWIGRRLLNCAPDSASVPGN